MCYKLFSICFLGLSLVISIPAEPVQIKLKISPNKNRIECDQTKAKQEIYKTTILEGEPLELIVDYNKSMNYVQCSQDSYPDNIFIPNLNIYNKSIIKIPTAKKGMEGLWNCTILVNKGSSLIKPNITYEGVQHAAAYCHIKIHVASLKPPQMILVNRIELTTRRRSLENGVVNYGGTYNYSSGDMVDVFCVNHDFKCNQIEMSYDYAEKLDDMFKSQNMKNGFVESASNLGAGFRATLRAEHKDSHMTCTCRSSDETAIVTVTFVLIEDFEKNANLKINGLTVRHYMYVVPLGIFNLDINYYISFDKEQIKVVCDTDKNDIVLDFVNDGKESCKLVETDQENSSTNISVLVEPEKPCHLNFVVGKNGVTKEFFKMNISPLPRKFAERPAFTMDFSDNGALMEVYEYKNKHLIYYEYNDGDNVTVTCSKRDVKGGPITCIMLNKQEFCNKPFVSMDQNLTSKENKMAIECSLLQSEDKGVTSTLYKQIRVVFHMKARTTTAEMQTTVTTTDTVVITPETDQSEDQQLQGSGTEDYSKFWTIVIAAVAGLMCIVLVCVSTIIYKMRKRTPPRDSSVSNYENLGKNPEVNIYAEPVDTLEGAYATPIPKCQRPGKTTKVYPEPTYAELNVPQGASVSCSSNSDRSQYAAVRELYTQVLPKNARKNQVSYGNVFPDSRYVNSGNTEYVEPTYCQPYVK